MGKAVVGQHLLQARQDLVLVVFAEVEALVADDESLACHAQIVGTPIDAGFETFENAFGFKLVDEAGHGGFAERGVVADLLLGGHFAHAQGEEHVPLFGREGHLRFGKVFTELAVEGIGHFAVHQRKDKTVVYTGIHVGLFSWFLAAKIMKSDGTESGYRQKVSQETLLKQF